jgi:hydroxymethylpyrimidine/phosphomethylpyrimidine kinase
VSHSIPGRTVALTIAGSDSGGGAGIQADLRAFAALGVFGTSVLTAVTAQNPRAVSDVHPVSLRSVRCQLQAVLDAFAVGAVKTGMLFSASLIRTVAAALPRGPAAPPLVVDPVMVATSGARLLRDDAVHTLAEVLLPRAALITPNLPEAEILTGRPLRSPQAVRQAAVLLAERCGAAVLIKGGHDTLSPGMDVFCDGLRLFVLRAPVVADPPTAHGTGCALSAAIAAGLARGDAPLHAVCRAKAYVLGLLRHPVRVGPDDLFAMWPAARLPLADIVVEPVDAAPVRRRARRRR